MYRIIFRTCDKVHSLHKAPRPFGLQKRELIQICFRSLVKSLEGFDHAIHVVADDISDELREFFKEYPVVITEGVFGNDESLRVALRLALSFDADDWVYFCEDDYLHTPEAFLWIDDILKNRESILLTKSRRGIKRFIPFDHRRSLHTMPLIIHPPDYPDRYHARLRYPSYLFVSKYYHWRQISNTTFTFLASVQTLTQFRHELEFSTTGANDGFLSKKLFAQDKYSGRALCLSPIPGVATHMHEEVMTPLVDWKTLVEKLSAT